MSVAEYKPGLQGNSTSQGSSADTQLMKMHNQRLQHEGIYGAMVPGLHNFCLLACSMQAKVRGFEELVLA